ncbi:hypothetical protein G9A89_014087 [Geosiphon pyriformis]|nr:hypothetical protein G9A89_014087 [Geosiphon pyriformis]
MAYAPIAKLKKFTGKENNAQAIQADYFTVPQILNQFIRDLCSSILQHVCLLHLADLQATITNIRDFEAVELEANHVQAQPLTNNILPVTIIENKSLTAIFPFELEKPVEMPLFSGAALESKLITAIYIDAKVDGQHIKLILNSGSAGSIIT